MDTEKDRKRKKENNRDDEDNRKKKNSRRSRSRSRSPSNKKEHESSRKRRYSKSRSPEKSTKHRKGASPVPDDNGPPKEETRPVRKNKETDMLNTRTGGAYIPPARLRMMQAQITDKSSAAYQRLAWEALKKSIHGHINKINVGNIGIIIKELLRENIVRGRGLLCRSVISAQAASPTFTNVYAALVAAVNSRFPNIGELLLKRLVIQFKRGFKRNDKALCISSASFIAHLVNQRVAHEILALELLTLLVESPTDDSVEVAIAFLKECGQKLTEVSSKGVNAIFEMLRNILHEGQLDKRVQYMIEVVFQVWKDGFKDHPAVIEELELVPEEEQFTHLLMLDEATDAQDLLNIFKFDDKYEENEQKYKDLCKEILGSDAESGEDEESGSGSEESDDEEDEEAEKKVTIIDNTETNLIALRRTIYLTINSSLDFEECAHKLMKMQLKPGQEIELCHMFLDCCAEQRTYEKFYGLLAQRFCNINRVYIEPFENIFKDSYSTAHRLDTNRLRNVSKFFAHLLFTDSISWEALECVKLNEEDTTSSSRIYIKILFQELAEYMGLKKLNDRLKDPTLQEAFSGIFPRDNPKNTRFSINFFTSIGLGGLTDELREHLKQMPKNVLPSITEIKVDSDSSSSSSDDSSSSSSSDDSSDSEEEASSKSKKDKSKSKSSSKDPEATSQNNNKNKENIERWGHEGFYETYGKDARRQEPERDKDNFLVPRNPRDSRNDRRRDRDDDRRTQTNEERPEKDQGSRYSEKYNRRERDGENSRKDDSRRERDDENSRRDKNRRDRDDENSRRDDSRRERDDENSKRGESRRERDNENSRRGESRRERDSENKGREETRRERDSENSRRDDSRRERDSEDSIREDSGRERDTENSRRDDSRRERDSYSQRERSDNRAPKSYWNQEDVRRISNDNEDDLRNDSKQRLSDRDVSRQESNDRSYRDRRKYQEDERRIDKDQDRNDSRRDRNDKRDDTESHSRKEESKRYRDDSRSEDDKRRERKYDSGYESKSKTNTTDYRTEKRNGDKGAREEITSYTPEKEIESTRDRKKDKKRSKKKPDTSSDSDSSSDSSVEERKKKSKNVTDDWDIKNREEIEKEKSTSKRHKTRA